MTVAEGGGGGVATLHRSPTAEDDKQVLALHNGQLFHACKCVDDIYKSTQKPSGLIGTPFHFTPKPFGIYWIGLSP